MSGDPTFADLIAQRVEEPLRLNTKQRSRLRKINSDAFERQRRRAVHRRNMNLRPPAPPSATQDGHRQAFGIFGPRRRSRSKSKTRGRRRRMSTAQRTPPQTPQPVTPPPPTPPRDEFFIGHRVVRSPEPVSGHRVRNREAPPPREMPSGTNYVSVAAASYLRPPTFFGTRCGRKDHHDDPGDASGCLAHPSKDHPQPAAPSGLRTAPQPPRRRHPTC
eukprot:Hpha_TRINITY_DN717_c0_g1::TRINITY_DN717_c0_g1_i1::g.28922::m.28922